MGTSVHTHPALVRPVAVGFALTGCYLLGSGLYDPFVDHETLDPFDNVTRTLVTSETDADQFHRLVGYRLFLGVLLSFFLMRLAVCIACGGREAVDVSQPHRV